MVELGLLTLACTLKQALSKTCFKHLKSNLSFKPATVTTRQVLSLVLTSILAFDSYNILKMDDASMHGNEVMP